MDLTNRGQQFQPNPEGSDNKQSGPSSHNQHSNKKSSKVPHKDKLLKIFQFGLLVSLAVLIAGILLSIATYEKNGEDKYVDTNKYQAVFLNGGQVYFGKIAELNPESLVLSDIYYLRVTQQVQPGQENQQNNFTLAKLGCELHRPTDIMVVNKEQVIFWENLKDEEGANTVTGAIKQYQQTTNGEQNCDEQQQPASTTDDATTTDNAADNTTGTRNDNANN
jgi:hypothetical protein